MPFWPVISLCILISVFGINKIWISYGSLTPAYPGHHCVPRQRQKVKFNQPLSISQLATAFLLMTTGMLISISVFFVELLNRPNGKATGAKLHKVAWGISTTRRNKNDKLVQESLMFSGPHISLEWISCCQEAASRQNQQSFIDTLTLLRKYYMHIACEIN